MRPYIKFFRCIGTASANRSGTHNHVIKSYRTFTFLKLYLTILLSAVSCTFKLNQNDPALVFLHNSFLFSRTQAELCYIICLHL